MRNAGRNRTDTRATPKRLPFSQERLVAREYVTLEPVFTVVPHRPGGPFAAILRCFSLPYAKYGCVKTPCLAAKSLASPARSDYEYGFLFLRIFRPRFYDKAFADLVNIPRANGQNQVAGRGSPAECPENLIETVVEHGIRNTLRNIP